MTPLTRTAVVPANRFQPPRLAAANPPFGATGNAPRSFDAPFSEASA